MYNMHQYPENVTILEYIWIEGSGQNIRSKTKVLQSKINSLQEVDWIIIDGTQCQMDYINIYIKPIYMCPDPFRMQSNAFLVLTETYLIDKQTPHVSNFRHLCNKIMNERTTKDQQPQFGIEQEYMIYTSIGTTHSWPLNWPVGGYPSPMGEYYSSVGTKTCFGRVLAEIHARFCLYSGILIAGINAEAVASQWEYQIGIASGIEGADMLWMSRYILVRLAEQMNLQISFNPKPFKGDWKGQGGHVNYSTKQTREQDGLNKIMEEYIPRLQEKHMEHISVYGEANQMRLQGSQEASFYNKFNFKEGSRDVSIRIPVLVKDLNQGYLEDRRPSSNMEPYLVLSIIVDTTLLESEYCDEILIGYKKYIKYLKKMQIEGFYF